MITFLILGVLVVQFFILIYISKIKDVLHNSPMGIVEWMNHGKRYGYWDKCKSKNKEELKK